MKERRGEERRGEERKARMAAGDFQCIHSMHLDLSFHLLLFSSRLFISSIDKAHRTTPDSSYGVFTERGFYNLTFMLCSLDVH